MSKLFDMKSTLTKVALLTALTTGAQAGAIVDIEVGGGVWSTGAPTGNLEIQGVNIDLADEANLGSTSDNSYLWLVIDHAIPIVPNIRIEQTTLTTTGTNDVNIAGLISGTATTTDVDLSHMDYIAYWGVPFATWLPFLDELDFGVGAKVFSGDATMDNGIAGDLVYQSFDGATIPYGYGKVRIESPLLFGMGFEAETKYIGYDGSSFSEFIVKADWGMLAPLPVVDMKVGAEIGYRAMSINVDTSDLTTDVEFNGIFFGLFGKFGI